MPIRFQADADFNQIIVSAVLRHHQEIDFRTATAAGLAGLNDLEVLALAARDGRVLVTHDHRVGEVGGTLSAVFIANHRLGWGQLRDLGGYGSNPRPPA